MEVRNKFHTPTALSPTEQPGDSVAPKMGVDALTLAEFETLFSGCADGSPVTSLKLSWQHSAYFLLFLLRHFVRSSIKGLTTKKKDMTEPAVNIIDRFDTSAPYNLLVFCSCSPHGNEGRLVTAPWPRYWKSHNILQ